MVKAFAKCLSSSHTAIFIYIPFFLDSRCLFHFDRISIEEMYKACKVLAAVLCIVCLWAAIIMHVVANVSIIFG